MEQHPTTVTRALDVLFHLHGERRPAGVTDIARALDMPKANVHRLLTALATRDLVERVGRGRYRTGIGLVSLGLGVLDREPVVAVARATLERGTEALGETLFLAGARAGRVVVLDKAEGNAFLRAAPAIGETIPLHATATGRLYLAYAPDEVAEAAGPREPYTATTTTDDATLAREVRRAREQGWAANREEWIPGLVVIAAPVIAGDRMRAAVAVAAPAARIAEDATASVASEVVALADEIGRKLRGVPKRMGT